jgi:hypothetical protein
VFSVPVSGVPVIVDLLCFILVSGIPFIWYTCVWCGYV